jgi:5-methylcytosine-specific restriction endonuclease McrA
VKKEKPYNSGQWTAARYRSFIMSALRRAQYPVKYECIRAAYRRDGVNPKTGRKCKLHECAECHELFPGKDMRADHIEPIVPITGFDSWDYLIDRLFCEIDGFQALCVDCHAVKTKAENKARREYKSKQ